MDYNSGYQPFFARVPLGRKKKTHVPLCNILETISVFLSNNLKLMKIWRTPRDFSRTLGGTRTPGWELLDYNIVLCY